MRQARGQLLEYHRGLQAPVVKVGVLYILSNVEGKVSLCSPGPPALPEPPTHLLQGGPAEFQGDVVELGAPLRAEVAEHIGVPVGLLQQLDLPPNQTEALSEQPFDSHCPTLKLSPGRWVRGQGFRESR